MSYDISLVNKDTDEQLYINEEHNLTGGTYAVGGTKELYLNITFNYCNIYKEYDLYIPDLDNQLVVDVISKLCSVYAEMEGEPSDNYWEPTEGNAKRALKNLITLCSMAPDAKIKVAY